MTNFPSGSFSLADAERLHDQVGHAICQKFLYTMMPNISGIGLQHRLYIASERLLLIRLAARVYTFKHEKSPSSLQELVDDTLLDENMIIDPVSGKTFLLKKNTAFEAYSVGRDFDDDGGVPWEYLEKSGDTILIPLKEMWKLQ